MWFKYHSECSLVLLEEINLIPRGKSDPGTNKDYQYVTDKTQGGTKIVVSKVELGS